MLLAESDDTEIVQRALRAMRTTKPASADTVTAWRERLSTQLRSSEPVAIENEAVTIANLGWLQAQVAS